MLQYRLCEEVLHFNAGPEKATCTEVQFLCAGGALISLCLVQLWFPASYCSILSLFLQPVISVCTYLKPLFFALIPPQLYKETVFFLCVFVTSFAVSHYKSKLVILSPLDLDLS